jgi:hypothetical protein
MLSDVIQSTSCVDRVLLLPMPSPRTIQLAEGSRAISYIEFLTSKYLFTPEIRTSAAVLSFMND